MKISAIILAKNEEAKIARAVSALLFCDEVLVVDDESTDDTAKIAKRAGAQVFIHSKNNNFSVQRNWAMGQAKNDWILFVDADEIVSEELKNEIGSCISHNDGLQTTQFPIVYAIPRRDFFWNREMKYGETRSARKRGIVRFMKKRSGEWSGAVHENFIPKGTVGILHSFLDHYSHDSLSSFIHDINIYSSNRALELAHSGKKSSTLELIILPFGKFVYTYFLLGGLFDGPPGFVYSFIMSFHSFLVRAKLATKLYD